MRIILLNCSCLFIILFNACKTKNYSSLLQPFRADTTYTSIRKNAFFLLTEKIGYPILTKGINGFEMRVWAPCHPYLDHLGLVIIRQLNGKWEYSFTHIALKQPRGHPDSLAPMLRIRIDSVSKIQIKPNKENQFLDSLVSLNLQNSPNQAEWEHGLFPDTGNYVYTIEVANKQSYRIISYTCAHREGGFTPHDLKFQRFLKLLKAHFGVALQDCVFL